MRYWLPLTLLALLTAVAYPVYASPISYTWGSFDEAGTAVGWVDASNTPLPPSSVIQLIWVGPDGTLNPPDPATGEPGGDDELLQTRAITPNSQLPPPFRNKGYLSPDFFTFYETDPWANNSVYMRGWNGTIAGRQGDSTAYGDSQLFTLTENGRANPLGVLVNRQVSAVALRHVGANASAATGMGWLLASFLALAVLSGLCLGRAQK
jgi:hypothetical protein